MKNKIDIEILTEWAKLTEEQKQQLIELLLSNAQEKPSE